MRHLLVIIVICLASGLATKAQKPIFAHHDSIVVVNGDTLPHYNLSTTNIYNEKKNRRKQEDQQYWRLVMRVKKVLPYAREAAALMKKYEMEVPADARGRDRRVYIRKAEDELMSKYGPTLKKFSINDGKVLIKLIDRETNKISYELIHELKGDVSAVFWQGVARIFGNNLKTKYDPWGEDRQIEQIIQYIEMGII